VPPALAMRVLETMSWASARPIASRGRGREASAPKLPLPSAYLGVHSGVMTADHAFASGPVPRDPDAIRASLGSADRRQFSEEYQSALEGAKVSFSLRDLDEVIERWWRFANLADGHERSVRIAALVLGGDDVAVVPAERVLSG
jgi:hypothetical protein